MSAEARRIAADLNQAADRLKGHLPKLAKMRAQVDAADAVLVSIAEKYHASAKAYHAAENRHEPDNSVRVFHRVRLGVLQEIGDELAAAPNVAAPDWEFLYETAKGATQ